MELLLVLYKIPFFHSSFLYSRHWGLVSCHESQYFFFLLVVLFEEFRLPSVNFIYCRFSIKDCGYPSSTKRFFFLKFELFSSKVVSEELFRRIFKASPLTNSFFNIWRVTRGECKKLSVCLKCVFASRIDFSLNLCAFVYNRV